MAEITMPKMGDGMEEGTINAWLKKEGDQVKSGEPIAEIETDKASVEINAYETGILTQIIVKQGETVPVGAVIGVIGSPSAKSSAPTVAPATPKESPKEKEAVAVAATPVTVPNGANGHAHAPVITTERVKASPLVRAMAREMGLELALLTGTGPGGRIVQRDVLAYLETHKAQPTVPALPVLPVVEAAPTPVAQAVSTTSYQDIPTSNMRKAIAKRTVQSKQTTPHFYVTMLVEMDRALALLKELNADTSAGKVTVNDIIVKACAVSLAKVPEVNATWTPENTIRRYNEAHIGVAVGIDEGLIIPVVRDCHIKTLRQISADAKQLIVKARNGQLKPEEYSGGTFSVSNLGMMGVDEFIAIVNPPEAAILAIGGISRDPVVVGDSDQIVIKSRMKITISADHRLLDGVVAAKFLQEVKKALEAPFSLLS